MKHTKKLLLLGALAALVVFVAGCGAQSGGDGSDGGTEQNQAAEEKSLTGTLDEVKDFMFVVTDDSGVSYSLTLEGGEVKDVAGFTCKRGKEYACKEVTNPTRIVTSTVRLTGSKTGAAVVSCKTAQDIPKGKIFAVAAALKQVVAKAPVEIGDVLLANVAGTGVDIVATKAVE